MHINSNIQPQESIRSSNDDDSLSPEEFMLEIMMTEWRGKVLTSDGLTDEDNQEW